MNDFTERINKWFDWKKEQENADRAKIALAGAGGVSTSSIWKYLGKRSGGKNTATVPNVHIQKAILRYIAKDGF